MKPKLYIHGMLGMGDCLKQRAVLRELMRDHDVTLLAYYGAMYHDLVAEGLKLTFPVNSRVPPRIKERATVPTLPIARGTPARRLTYNPADVAAKRQPSLLAVMFASVGLAMPSPPDFSLPVPPEWRAEARELIASWPTNGRPVLIYRPIILSKVWEAPARSPDPEAYAALFAAIRDRFFVVSIANLDDNEWIVGGEQDADVKLHRGELHFETLAGLVAEADAVFGNPGFTPVLAQAVGTPTICVYGGNESFRTTNSVGAHLAPTLAIEPIRPCECHVGKGRHNCDKTIDVPAAIRRLEKFVDGLAAKSAWETIKTIEDARDEITLAGERTPHILIFGTTYVDTADKLQLAEQWVAFHTARNPGADLLFVDSASPAFWCADGAPAPGLPKGARIWSFPDNIGHLSRGGRDGWGRAFCRGLEMAIDEGYDYVAHIEGDSLFRVPVAEAVARMQREQLEVVSVPVEGTRRKEVGWVETGLMVFDVGYLRRTDFVRHYDWPNRTVRPTPEKVIFNLLDTDLRMMPWRAERGDKSQFTAANVAQLDWITHTTPEMYAAFLAANAALPKVPARPERKSAAVAINLGCGLNRLPGWRNHDSDVDITRPLPFGSASADFMFAEHVVEHVTQHQGIGFFREARRVLKPGGVLRIAVPSLDRILKHGTPAYFEFARKWAPSADVRGAMHAIAFAHGHQAIWTEASLGAALYLAGFDRIEVCRPGASTHDMLAGVEGHGRVIGEEFNAIETIVAEAS